MKKTLLLFIIIFSFSSVQSQTSIADNYLVNGDVLMFPFKRLDTLKICLVSEDSVVELMLKNYTNIQKEISKSNVLLFTSIKDFEKYNGVGEQKTIVITNKNIFSVKLPDVEIVINNDEDKADVIQKMFGASTGLYDNGARFAFGNAEDVGIDSKKLSNKIDSIANEAIRKGVAPGVQVLVARYGVVVLHKTYGYQTYDSIKKVEKDNIYDWASVTKITSALPALMKLYDEDKFDVDSTIGSYIPYFSTGNKKNLTFKRILSHNAGLKPYISYWQTTTDDDGNFKKNTLSHKQSQHYQSKIAPNLYLFDNYKTDIYKQINESEISTDANPKYKYSGLSFYLLPEIVENLSGVDYQDYLKNDFYSKLGANTVCYNPLNIFDKDIIIPTEEDDFFRHTLLHGTVHDEGASLMEGVSANAGLFGTTLDLAKIMQMYLWKGEYGRERYISEKTVNEFTSAHFVDEGNKRGLGFDKPRLENRDDDSCSKDASMNSFGHSGYTGTFTWADPDTGILFVFMSNRVYPTRNNRKIYKYNVRPSMHQAIYDAIINDNI
ncbi:MAG: serine hydrolase [Ichthyobacteriaceae bacterium]|nr:serine hydrolase [Ichthyobacteriaceae bacterium]